MAKRTKGTTVHTDEMLVLPGGLKVRRLAPRLFVKIQHHCGNDPMMAWIG